MQSYKERVIVLGASLVVQMGKNLSSVQETWVQSLGQEDPLEKGMAIYFSILAWRIPWTEKPGRLRFIGSQRVGHTQSDLAAAAAELINNVVMVSGVQ